MLWVIIGVAATAGLLWSQQRRLIYFPERAVPPIERLLPGWTEEVVTTADGLALTAWYSAPPPGAPVVIVFNGNGGNRAGRAPLGRELAAAGMGVVLFDYRGYGGNPGGPSEEGLARDSRAVADFVVERAPGSPQVLLGESLGAAVAIELATERTPAALVLRSPFTSLADVAGAHYPLLPVRLLLRDHYPSDARIGAVAAPVLVIAGSADEIVPIEQSRTIFELASEPKELVVIEAAHHNDPALLDGRELIDAILRFVDEHT